MSIKTDSKKLEVRINAHKQYSKYDINEWIISCVQPRKNEKLLDIGCGTGEQILRLSKFCGSFSEIIALDASDDSLKKVKNLAIENDIQNIIIMKGNMDELQNLLGSKKDFDLVISCFALYYSENIPKIILDVKKILSREDRFFVCGPTSGNNIELIEFQSQIMQSKIKQNKYPMTEYILPEIEKNFSHIKKYYFSNPITFPNYHALVNYWKSYYLYDPKIEEQFITHLKKYFQTNTEFITTKRVLGVIARV